MVVETVLCVASISATMAGVPAVERKAIGYRQAIERMSVTWSRTAYNFPKGVRTVLSSGETRMWRDGSRLRTDIKSWFPKERVAIRELVGRDCDADKTLVHWFERGDERTILSYIPSSLPDLRFREQKMIDPRMLGLYPASSPNLNQHHRHMESLLGRPDRENVSIRQMRWKNSDCRVVQFRLLQGTGVDSRLWIVPDWGPSVARIEMEWQSPEKHFMDSVECDYQKDTGSGIWYPKTCKYLRTINATPEKEEDLVVENLYVNKIVPGNAFEISGMDLPTGTHVVGHPDANKRGRIWDGKALVLPDQEKITATEASALRARPLWKLLLLANAIMLSVLAGFFIWRSQRRIVGRSSDD